MADAPRGDLLARFRLWLLWGLAAGAALYLAGSLWAGIGEMGGELRHFAWWLVIPILLLSTANYGLRFLKWHFFLRHLGIRVPWRDDLLFFTAGLAMVISPGKAGEVLKPWLVRARTGANMATSIPALLAERLTDGIAMLILAAFGVATYAGDKIHYLTIPAAVVALLLALLASRRASMGILRQLVRLPGLARVGHKLEEMYLATRSCLSPGPLLLAIAVSVLAWWAECVGYWLVFHGFGVAASLDLTTFLYAFATVAGGAMPGGLGVADGALGAGAWKLVPEITRAQALASALLVRMATLWYGVGLGAVALLRVGTLLQRTGPAEPGTTA